MKEKNVSPQIPHLGVVVIGRDESTTLARALDSVTSVASVCVYVDSASRDNSVEIARSHGVRAVRLPDDGRLSPARARNAGFSLLQQTDPELRTVFFLDGDCVASRSWLREACTELDGQTDLGVLCGHLRERHPERTVYNRLFDFGWQNVPDGPTLSCGGIFLARAEAIRESGGFEPGLRAGEELHMCWRMSRRGWRASRVPGVMATHDADMHSLGEWLGRSRRDGYGAMQLLVSDPRGVGRYHVRPTASAWSWTAVWAACVAAAFGAMPSRGRLRAAATVALPFMGALPVAKALQIAHRVERQGRLSRRDATAYGLLMIVSKWSFIHGQLLCVLDLSRSRRRLRQGS